MPGLDDTFFGDSENTPQERQVVSDMLRGERDLLAMLGLS